MLHLTYDTLYPKGTELKMPILIFSLTKTK